MQRAIFLIRGGRASQIIGYIHCIDVESAHNTYAHAALLLSGRCKRHGANMARRPPCRPACAFQHNPAAIAGTPRIT